MVVCYSSHRKLIQWVNPSLEAAPPALNLPREETVLVAAVWLYPGKEVNEKIKKRSPRPALKVTPMQHYSGYPARQQGGFMEARPEPHTQGLKTETPRCGASEETEKMGSL